MTAIYSLLALEAGSLRSGVGRADSFRGCEETAPGLAPGCWWSLAVCGVPGLVDASP